MNSGIGHYLFAANSATLYDDVVPTLQRLRAAGFKLAIVSNWDTPLDPLTERLGIAEYFDAIVASHDVRVRSEKPDPHIFNYALAAVGVSAEEAVHVGDTYRRISSEREMSGFVRYCWIGMAHRPADGRRRFRAYLSYLIGSPGCQLGTKNCPKKKTKRRKKADHKALLRIQ